MPSTYQLLVGKNTGLFSARHVYNSILQGTYLSDQSASKRSVFFRNIPTDIEEHTFVKMLNDIAPVDDYRYLGQFKAMMIRFLKEEDAANIAETFNGAQFENDVLSAVVYFDFAQALAADDTTMSLHRLVHRLDDQDNEDGETRQQDGGGIYTKNIFYALTEEIETNIHPDDNLYIFDLPPVKKQIQTKSEQ